MTNNEPESKVNGLIFAKNNIKPPVEGRCGFFVKRKQRYCKMKPTKGTTFCAEHAQHDGQNKSDVRKRIPCPLDPKHSVFEDKLATHVKKCNATKKTQLPFFEANFNLGINGYVKSEEEKLPLHQAPLEELQRLITKLQLINDNIIGLISGHENNAIHQTVVDEIARHSEAIGPNVRKHLLQQGSLIQIMHNNNFLRSNMNVVEFGAGRGALSHWVQKAMKDQPGCQYFLIDRQHNRNKFDSFHKGEEQGPNFQRLNIDIINLDLDKVEALRQHGEEPRKLLAIGKHLCGGATDLSLRCLFKSKQNNRSDTTEPAEKKAKKDSLSTTAENIGDSLHGIVFALCCYHRCTWDTYVGLDFLRANDFTPTQFHWMTKMATWSTCGFQRRSHEEDGHSEEQPVDGGDEEKSEVNEEVVEKIHTRMRLSIAEQEKIGMLSKRILDYGRIQYIEKQAGLEACLVKYTSRDVTPENIALVVKNSQGVLADE